MNYGLKNFGRSQHGTVTVVVAMVLPLLMAFVGLVAEFGVAFARKAENQRIADTAAYAGAMAYGSSSSSTDMEAAVARLAVLHGLDASEAVASLSVSPRGNGAEAISVLVSTNQTVLLTRALGGDSGLLVAADAMAEVPIVERPGCVFALDPSQSGITLSGGSRIDAAECAVSSASAVSVPCGTFITTIGVHYNSASVPSQPCAGIRPPTGKTLSMRKAATADPLAGNSGVTSATARLASVASMAAPTIPGLSVSAGTDLNFPWSETTAFKNTVANAGCTATYSNGWIISCPAGGTYNFGAVTIQNGVRLEAVNGNGSGTATYNFKGAVKVDNGSFSFGPGTYNFARNLIVNASSTTFGAGNYTIEQGLYTGGGTRTSFGKGTFKIGAGTAACGSSKHSICNEGSTLTFDGPSNFTLSSGIYNKGGSTLALGSGTTNSYDIGASQAGNALLVGGGSTTVFADALGSTVKFGGNINADNGGGSCLTLPAADQHDIKGYISTAGGNKFGAGIYTVTGYVGFGAQGGGGNVDCSNASVGVDATNVTFVIGGTPAIGSGNCSGQAFCVASGYSSVVVTAPSTGTTAKLAIIGPTSGTAGASLTQGATHTKVSGAFYFPVGPIVMSAGAGIGDGPGECLQLIGSRIAMSGGTAAASTCVSNESPNNGQAVLVQ